MNTLLNEKLPQLQRRGFLAGGAGLVVALALPMGADAAEGSAGPSAQRLDSWLAVGADGEVTASVGKIDAGLGIATAFSQIVADELDVPLSRVHIRMGDTATTVDQRGTGSSNGITDGGSALRLAAAQARAFLLARAAERLALPAEQLQTRDGKVFVTADPSRSLSYSELLGDGRFDIAVDPKAKPVFKDARDYRYVGKPVPRADIAAKATAQFRYLVDFRLPGMVHARVLRPPTAGAKLLGVQSLPATPGFIKLVTIGNFAAVVCEQEAQAVRAAREVRLNWSGPTFEFPANYDALYAHLRTGPAEGSKVDRSNGDVDAALKTAAKTVEGWYEYPFQSHASMGPGCAVAQVGPQGVTVWAGGQKPYPLRKAIAEMLERPQEQVRVTWMPGPGSYGMNDADDAAIDATLIAREIGRPVRLQYDRAGATAWDAKGPPGVFRMRGAVDGAGRVAAFEFHSRGYSGRTRPSSTEHFGDTLAAQLIGGHKPHSEALYQVSADGYQFDNKRVGGELLPWGASLATGLRTTHLRDPDGMATCFASESFVDELAFAARTDPVEFRLRHLGDTRDAAVVRAAAERAGWTARVGPQPRTSGGMLRGRGIAYAPRNNAIVAVVAEVEVEAATGKWRATRFVVAHDCGMVINPRSLAGVIESNMLMSLSRARHEEVRFNEREVTSVDWASYPILDMTEVPDSIDVVLVGNKPGRSYGAGEPSTRPVAAALGNALFDATGRRLRRVPFTPQRLLAAMSQAPASA
ncbi:MAG: nicB 3 [Ramlibacter sp.]|nr:nicB 3 [Ramlibacter sp.]